MHLPLKRLPLKPGIPKRTFPKNSIPKRSPARRSSPSSPLFVVVLLAALVCLVVAQATAAEAPARGERQVRTLDQILDSGKLVMITFPHQQSTFSRLDLEKGAMPRVDGTARFEGVDASHFEGIDVELMELFADHLGVHLEVRPVSQPSYGALIPDLYAGRGDLVASSLTITEERRQKVDFSVPYFSVYPVILALRDSGIESLDDLEGKTASVMEGSSHEERLLHLGIEPENLLRVDFTVAAIGAVLDGEADYTLQDSMAARRQLEANPQLERAFRLGEEEHYGIAVPEGSELKEALDAFLEELKESGELQEILEKYGEG